MSGPGTTQGERNPRRRGHDPLPHPSPKERSTESTFAKRDEGRNPPFRVLIAPNTHADTHTLRCEEHTRRAERRARYLVVVSVFS